MLRKSIPFLIIPAIVLSLLVACTDQNDGPSPGSDRDAMDRKALLTTLADQIIIPSYDNFKAKLDPMQAATDAFVVTPNQANLAILRQTWVAAYTDWQKVELFDIGPAETRTLRFYFNI